MKNSITNMNEIRMEYEIRNSKKIKDKKVIGKYNLAWYKYELKSNT